MAGRAGANPQTIKIGSSEIYLDNIYRHVRGLPVADEMTRSLPSWNAHGRRLRHRVHERDGYAAAQLLLPEFMRRVRQALNAALIFAGIPSRDFLVAWTPDFAPRRAFASKIAQDFQGRPHPLTDALFASTDTGVRLADAAALRDHGR